MAMKLHPGEQMIYEGHPSWRAILDFYLKGLIAVAIVCLLVALGTNLFGDETNKSLVIILAIAGTAAVILAGFVKRVATRYTITNQRLHIKRGIVSRTIQETRLQRVQNVNFTQSVFQRVLQIGNVDFDTAAGDDYNFIFEGVDEPEDVVQRVSEATRILGGGDGVADEPSPAPPGQPG
jgi:uncharacterized membrane protein YdbT with pleckstrin-like domain